MNLDRELCHKSEDIEDDVLLDAVRAIRRRVRTVSHDFDIPYIAGYSVDGLPLTPTITSSQAKMSMGRKCMALATRTSAKSTT